MKSKDTVKEVRKFNLDWLKDSDLKPWLSKKLGADRKYYPKCLACDITFINKKSTLLAHSKTDKHKAAVKDLEKKQLQQNAMSAFIADPLTQNVKSLEVRLCLLLAEKNISLSTGEKILNVFKKEIPGHPLLSRASLGKTKASNLLRDGRSLWKLALKSSMPNTFSICKTGIGKHISTEISQKLKKKEYFILLL